ncbi:hypothetical protein [Geobacter sp. AOG1]|uniref:hypothetical protein n=1 Tax=Geobacter sp. AOG1 TaxID=1566346 RepID=UPI001CC5251E|nr:hypothetical protein [Geobacter sp. AOG1]GFE57737.1 hypothetical protein AOG1_16170 [Geobacter sp. AOG1]
MAKRYNPFDYDMVVICETTPRPMEPIARVEAHMIDGKPVSITAWLPSEGQNYLRYDFFTSPDSWREIITHLAPFLGMKVIDANEKTGRGAATVPADMVPFLEAIETAQATGRPYHKTGRNGLYARRAELPAGYNGIGRDRLESLAGELLKAGALSQDEAGALAIPDSVTDS